MRWSHILGAVATVFVLVGAAVVLSSFRGRFSSDAQALVTRATETPSDAVVKTESTATVPKLKFDDELSPQDTRTQSSPSPVTRNASTHDTLCPHCTAHKCAVGSPREKQPGCLTLFDNIDNDLRYWRPKSVTWTTMLREFGKHFKSCIIHWDGVDRVQMVANDLRMRKRGTAFTKPLPNSYVLFAKLVGDVVQRADLPPFELVFSPMDKMAGHMGPVFGMGRGSGKRGILWPNVVRTRGRVINGSFSWGHDFFAFDAVPWEAKVTDVFYRGSLVGSHPGGYDPKLFLICMGRKGSLGTKRPKCQVDTAVACNISKFSKLQKSGTDAWKYDYCKQCGGSFVPFADGAKHKFLVIPQGNGYTGRYKDYLAFNSLNIKFYKSTIHEHFEAGMVHGPDGHFLDASGGSYDDFVKALDWAYANDNIVKRMAARSNAHVRWALSDETVLCYVYKLLKKYATLLSYNAASRSALHSKTRGAKGADALERLRLDSPTHHHDLPKHTEFRVKRASEEERLKFIRGCEALKYPKEAQPNSG